MRTETGYDPDITRISYTVQQWLFELAANCNNANLNFDEGTDLLDMAMFTDLYSAGARRVDMNADGTTDAADAAIYADEYDKATGP